MCHDISEIKLTVGTEDFRARSPSEAKTDTQNHQSYLFQVDDKPVENA